MSHYTPQEGSVAARVIAELKRKPRVLTSGEIARLLDVPSASIGASMKSAVEHGAVQMRGGKDSESANITNCVPLADAGVSVHDVGAFWDAQPFTLGLPSRNGRTTAGNCELCFLKPAAQILSLIREKPSRAIWWAEAEAAARASKPSGAVFRSDRPSYAQMAQFALDQGDMFDQGEEAISCFCGD